MVEYFANDRGSQPPLPSMNEPNMPRYCNQSALIKAYSLRLKDYRSAEDARLVPGDDYSVLRLSSQFTTPSYIAGGEIDVSMSYILAPE